MVESGAMHWRKLIVWLPFAGLLLACGTNGERSVNSIFRDVSHSGVAIQTNPGGGSGVVFDDLGHIVTNYHVVRGANKIEVIFKTVRS